MQNPSYPNFSQKEVERIADSAAGKQLVELMRNSFGSDLKAAISYASNGDYEKIQDSLRAFLSDPEAQKLLEQIRGGKIG